MARPSQLDPVERELVLRLQKERLRQGISATQLASKIGISRATITHLESDDARPTLWVLLKIAEGLGVNLAEYLGESATAIKPPKAAKRKE